LHWVRFPHISNAQDAAPWHDDTGVALHWTSDPGTLAAARVVVLPGSKNTIADLAWLHETGLAAALLAAHAAGAHIVGICGGFQMLGEEISDPAGLAGDAGTLPGVGLLPARTVFSAEKEVRNVVAEWRGERWTGYEIHMGRTHFRSPVEPMLHVTEQTDGECCSGNSWRGEGAHSGRVWGTYVHGLFESTEIRKALAHAAGAEHHGTPALPWRTRRRAVYNGMADLLEEHLHLEPLWRYVAH
jgi:adenosylcobyric acid synthase